MKIALLIVILLFVVNKDGRPEDKKFIPPAQLPPPPERREIFDRAAWEDIRTQRNLERSENTIWLKEKTKKYSPESWYPIHF